MVPFDDADVAAKFEAYPRDARERLLALRELIFATAAATPGVGALRETLKWGEPAYLTRAGVGSPFRIDWKPRAPRSYAMYFHCQTDLVETFRLAFPDAFDFEGNRAIVLDLTQDPPVEALQRCIEAALTYHARKRKRRSTR
jgi:hypothetical protein